MVLFYLIVIEYYFNTIMSIYCIYFKYIIYLNLIYSELFSVYKLFILKIFPFSSIAFIPYTILFFFLYINILKKYL